MEGKKFSSSKRVVIYVRDLLSRYQPDAFRYFVAAAGPENQDSDFTWAEFVRRTNDELVAGWGNLVNRTATLIPRTSARSRRPVRPRRRTRRCSTAAEAAFDTVGDLIGRHRMKQAIGEAMRAVAEVNKYVSDSEPWKIKDDPARLGTVLHVVAQCVRRPQPGALAVPAVLGQRGRPGARRRGRRRADAAHRGGRGPRRRAGRTRSSPATTPACRPGRRHPIVVGAPVAKPTPIFTKLDPSVVDEELARLAGP